MARGRQRIRQRGSRQQWARARTFKTFDGPIDEAISVPGAAGPTKPLGGADVISSTRCGLCGIVAEQRLRDGREVILVPYALCISCDEVRCEACWDADDDACGYDDIVHEFLEVRYAEDGRPAQAAFADWAGA